MEAAKNLYSAELAVLARNISCNFVDAQTSTKDYVRKLSEAGYHSESNPLTNHFVLSTCLRYEVYDCSKQQEHRAPLIYSNGTTCIRRLLSILVGLQSEIKGEREILSQVSSSIKDSYDKGYLNSTTFRGLQELIFISEQIRQSCGINSDENYSTIACDLFIDYLSDCKDAVIAIVGGGYMADKFFCSILKADLLNIKKIYWINRSTSILKERTVQLSHLLKFDIEILDLQTGRFVLKEVDAIFCALSKSPYFYDFNDYSEDCFLVDVSYPQVFSEGKNTRAITISNTHFENLAREILPKNKITLADEKIDDIINMLDEKLCS